MKWYQYTIRPRSAPSSVSPIPALLGPLPKSMTHRRLSDLLFKSSRSARRSFFYLQDNTVGKYKSIKMHLMHPFLDLKHLKAVSAAWQRPQRNPFIITRKEDM